MAFRCTCGSTQVRFWVEYAALYNSETGQVMPHDSLGETISVPTELVCESCGRDLLDDAFCEYSVEPAESPP